MTGQMALPECVIAEVVIPGKVTISEGDITIEGFTFAARAGTNAALEWALWRLAQARYDEENGD